MAKRKGSCTGSCLGAMVELMITIFLFPFMLIAGCAKDYKPMNSRGRRISNSKKKKWI